MIEHKQSEIGGSFFDFELDLEVVAAQQGVPAITNFEQLLGDFWPEDESCDDFIAAVRAWRHEEEGASGL